MALSGSVKLISKMVYFRCLLVFIAYADARTQFGPKAPVILSDLPQEAPYDNKIATGRYPSMKPLEKNENWHSLVSKPANGLYPITKSQSGSENEDVLFPVTIPESNPFSSVTPSKEYANELFNVRNPQNAPDAMKKHEIRQYLSPKHENYAYFPVELEKGTENDIFSTATLLLSEADAMKMHVLVDESQRNPATKPEHVETLPGRLYVIQEIEPEQLKSHSSFISPLTIKEESGSFHAAEPKVIRDNPSTRVENLPPLPKLTEPLRPPMKSQQEDENSQHPVAPTYVKNIIHVQDPIPTIHLASEEEESILLSHCIKMLQNGSYYPTPLSIVKDVLPAHVHDPLPPLPNPIGEIHTENHQTSEKGVQEVGKFHEPLPPLSNHIYQILVPIKAAPEGFFSPNVKDIPPVSVQDPLPPLLQASDSKEPVETALPITEGSFPAAVVPSGPFPVAVSVLKEASVVHVAEPLPPLQNTALTNIEIPKMSTLHAPKGPYPANLPEGSPYPPKI